jgi:GT2 family glycosyltransferase
VNQALERATSKVVLLLNSDATVEEGTIPKLVEVLETRPEIGAVGPWIVSVDGTPQHHCAARELSLSERLLWHFRLVSGRTHLAEDIGPHGTRRTERLSGAALAVRRNVIDRIGPLDERFFLFFEDADWVLRIRRAGFLAGCVTAARVTHALGASGLSGPNTRSAHSVRSELAYFRKHHGRWRTLLLRAGILLSSRLRAMRRSCLHP